jgi:hypothetical protein
MQETSVAPARFARRTKDWSNSIPWTTSARAASDGRLILGVHVFQAEQLRRTHPVSSITVFAIQMGPAANRDRAAAACLGSSPVSRRTSTLVSTAIMTPDHLASDGGAHLRWRFRFISRPQTAGDLVKIGSGETAGGSQHNSISGLFDDELRARYPGSGSTYVLGQDDPAFGRKPCNRHG